MFEIKLWLLSALLGLLVLLLNGYGVMKPAAYRAVARQFPRYTPIGVVLMLLATVWFIYNVSQESLSDFTRMKTGFYTAFAAVGIGCCLFVRDFLAVRALAAIMLLLAKWMVDTARPVETEWRLVIIVWAYVMIIAGMWLTLSPWRLRDFIEWNTATEDRTRKLCAARAAFGLALILLAVTAYRTAEAQQQTPASTASAPQPSLSFSNHEV